MSFIFKFYFFPFSSPAGEKKNVFDTFIVSMTRLIEQEPFILSGILFHFLSISVVSKKSGTYTILYVLVNDTTYAPAPYVLTTKYSKPKQTPTNAPRHVFRG